MIAKELLKKLKHIGGELGAPENFTPQLERPNNPDHGGWSTNMAMELAGDLQKSPREIAGHVVSRFNNDEVSEVEEIEIAGPGFINFRLKDEYYQHKLIHIDSSSGQRQLATPRRIIMEYGHPNTHKLPHVGHLFSYITGEAFARLLEANGETIKRVNYQGDIGPHVAKTIFGWIEKGRQKPQGKLERVQHLQECYQYGAQLYEEDEAAKAKIQEINKAVYDPNSDIQADWLETRQWSLDYYLEFEELIGIDQTIHYLESQLWRKGMEIVRENIGEVFEKSQGAIIYPGEERGLHNRVFITKHNTPTYECKEVGLNVQKMEDWEYDLTIIPTAAEQNSYFQVVIKAIEDAIPRLTGKIRHIGFGFVSLTTGKMSSRKGKILSAPDLVYQTIERVKEVMADRQGFEQEELEDIAEKVALAAIKYTFLRGNVLQDMVFDLEESISFEGESGPYLLYTYARIQSLIKDSGVEKDELDELTAEDITGLEEPAEMNLLKQLERYPETVEAAGEKLAPHIISSYLFELAQAYNQFYREHKINTEEAAIKKARLLLSHKTAIILQSALNLLGIETVERM